MLLDVPAPRGPALRPGKAYGQVGWQWFHWPGIRFTLRCGNRAAVNATIPPMDITLNGEPRQLAAQITLTQLLEQEGLAGRRVAVEVNGQIVPRGSHASHVLEAGDRVEIVHALGGG